MALTSTPNEYELVEVIKSGDQGRVERVRRTCDDTQWIRRIYPDDKREIFKVLASIDDRHIPHIEEIAFSDNTTVIEEDVPCITLREYMLLKKITRKQALSISEQLLGILVVLHDLSIIHRDIKPENILIDTDSIIHLIDFGIARIYRADSIRDTSLFGTAGYAAPEQYGFSQTDYRSDLYSVGMVMKELCASAGLKDRDRIFKIAERCASFDPNHRGADAQTAFRQLGEKGKHPLVYMASIILVLVLFCVVGYETWQRMRKVADSDISSPMEQSGVTIRLNAISEEQNRMYLSIVPKTRAKEIFYKLDTDADFRSTGFLQHIDPVSGLRLPNGTFSMSIASTLVVQTKYIDVEDKECGPFVTKLDITNQALDNVKHEILAEHIPWIEFRTTDLTGKQLSLFTHVFALRGSSYAVEKILYGIDAKKPTIVREPLNTPDPNNINARLGEIEKAKTNFVSMQVFFKDGTCSDIRIYEVDHSK